MKILLVQIKDFENNSLENEIQFFFESKNDEVIIKTFELSAPEEITKDLCASSNSFDYMIGIGLAAFFVLAETNSNAKIVINPWMSPSKKLSQREAVSQNLLSTLQKMEAKTYEWADVEMLCGTYGIFQLDADIFDKNLFLNIYGRDMDGVNNYSFMKEENLSLELGRALKYFEHIASLDYWKHMPGYITT